MFRLCGCGSADADADALVDAQRAAPKGSTSLVAPVTAAADDPQNSKSQSKSNSQTHTAQAARNSSSSGSSALLTPMVAPPATPTPTAIPASATARISDTESASAESKLSESLSGSGSSLMAERGGNGASKVWGRILSTAVDDEGLPQLLLVTDAASIRLIKSNGFLSLNDAAQFLFKSGALSEGGKYKAHGNLLNSNGNADGAAAIVKAAHLSNGVSVHSLNEIPCTDAGERVYFAVEIRNAVIGRKATATATATAFGLAQTGASSQTEQKQTLNGPAAKDLGFADPKLRGRRLPPEEFLREAHVNRPSMLHGGVFNSELQQQATNKFSTDAVGPTNLDLSVSIVGGGASGLSVAFYLLENKLVRGDCITIYEKSNRTGGKIESWKINDNWYEKGAAHLLNFYDTTFWLMNHFDVPFEPVQHFALKDYKFSEVFKLLLESAPMGLELIYYIHLIEDQKFNEFYSTASFKDVAGDSDLSLSVNGFLKKHKLEALKSFLGMMAYTLTSISADLLPMGIFLKLFPPINIKAFISYNIVDYLHLKIFFPHVGPPGYFVPNGYQTLMDKMTDYLISSGVKIKYGHTAKAIYTSDPKHPKLLLECGGNQLERTSDIVVFATLYQSTDKDYNPNFIDGLPCLPVLKKAESHVKNPAILKYHVRTNNSTELGDYLFVNATGETDTPYAVYNFAPKTNILATLSVKSPKTSMEQMKKNIQNSLQRCGFGDITFLTEEEDSGYLCKVQPAPDVEIVAKGYYNQLEDLQGTSNVYYSNIHYTFSYSGLVMQYGREVAQIICQDQRKNAINSLNAPNSNLSGRNASGSEAQFIVFHG